MDILFNNAGIGGGRAFADLPFETVMAVVRIRDRFLDGNPKK